MSSAPTNHTPYFRAILIACTAVLAFAIAIAATAPNTDATRLKASAKKAKLPKLTKVSPIAAVPIGTTLKLNGANFVKGKKKLIVIFKRKGSKRTFTARGDATSSTRGSVVVPDVSTDLVKPTETTTPTPQDNIYKLRAITRNGAAKNWTPIALSPRIDPLALPVGGINTSASGDCDADGQKNGVDGDDDNDLLPDASEASIGTDACVADTDADGPTDFYEYTVAYAYNGGPVLPYPGLRPFPNPLIPDSGSDFDFDGLTSLEEFNGWKFTGLMTRFYSDADQDSDGDGVVDGAEDEDGDMMPNLTELRDFIGAVVGKKPPSPLNWLRRDTDGDGLCDGLDDQDHDGPPTPLAAADCTTPVPNNGAGGTPPTDPGDSAPGVLADPDPSRIDGDDNMYSNFYEWYIDSAVAAYDPCLPSEYPTSPYCPADFNPFPVTSP
jgi:hypothetical protein